MPSTCYRSIPAPKPKIGSGYKDQNTPLRTRIVGSFATSVWDNTDFLPESCFEDLFTAETIKAELSSLPTKYSLFGFVYCDARRTFATALLAGMTGVELLSALETFRSHGFTDEDLPVSRERIEDLTSNESGLDNGQACPHEEPSHCFCHFPRTRDKNFEFEKLQRKFLVPVFKKDRRSRGNHLHAACPLPFVWMSSGKQELGSIVHEVRIHQDHQQISSAEGDVESIFAVKELVIDDRQSIWSQEAKAIEEIRAFSHRYPKKHTISFTRNNKYYFIYQWDGLGSLQSFWRDNLSPVADGQWVLEWLVQLRGKT